MDTNISNGIHHANLLIGDKEWARSCIREEDLTVCPDVMFREYDRMSIADVRSLIHDALLKPIARPYRVFHIATSSILTEAQNALLKLFEEPNTHTLFYVVIPREDILLPTLRSRFHLLGKQVPETDEGAFQAFHKATYNERLLMIAEKLKKEDGIWIQNIVHGAELHVHRTRDPKIGKEVLLLSSYINAPGSSKKMLLEHFALSL